jgi:hypothetical protein
MKKANDRETLNMTPKRDTCRSVATPKKQGATRIVDMQSRRCDHSLRRFKGLLGNDQSTSTDIIQLRQTKGRLFAASVKSDYRKQIKSDIADIKNIGRQVRQSRTYNEAPSLHSRNFVATRAQGAPLDSRRTPHGPTAPSAFQAKGPTGRSRFRTLLAAGRA